MSTTVRIEDADKDRLRKLQERFERKHGRIPTHQELLGLVIDHALADGDRFIERAVWRPLSPERILAMRKKQGHYGGVGAADIDSVLYGGDRP